MDVTGPGQPERLSRVVVTRPEPEASHWVEALRGHAWPALALPLIEIGEPRDEASLGALHHWRQRVFQADAVMFVSGAAVAHFFADADADRDMALQTSTRFWAPGPATATALRAVGVPADRIDAPPEDAEQFDSEALWPVVAPQVRANRTVLVVRGVSQDAAPATLAGSGREWLIRQCRAAGARVEACVAYERRAPGWSAEQSRLALGARGPGVVWLFSSSEALAHLQTLLPGADWRGTSALATHPRIAEAARSAGFGEVMASRPTLRDVVRALESTWSPA